MEQLISGLQNAFQEELRGRDERIKELEARLSAAERAPAKMALDVHLARERAAVSEFELMTVSKSLADKEAEVIKAESKRGEAEDEIEALSQRLERAEQEIEKLEEDCKRARRANLRLQEDVSESEAHLRSLNQSLTRYKNEITALKSKLANYEGLLQLTDYPQSEQLYEVTKQCKLVEELLEFKETELATCTTKLNLLICSMSMTSEEQPTRQQLLARAPNNAEGLSLVLKGSMLIDEPKRDVTGRYRSCTPSSSSSVVRGKWID